MLETRYRWCDNLRLLLVSLTKHEILCKRPGYGTVLSSARGLTQIEKRQLYPLVLRNFGFLLSLFTEEESHARGGWLFLVLGRLTDRGPEDPRGRG